MRKIAFLLAEDDTDDQGFFYAFLKDRGDIVLLPAVENGEEVMAYLETRTEIGSLPDVIILDQNMPRMNGLQTLHELRRHGQYSHIVVVVYSTYADERLTGQSLEAGASMVLSKPSTAAGYQEMIDLILAFEKGQY